MSDPRQPDTANPAPPHEPLISVLVVDDDPAVLRAWRTVLAAPHYRVTLIDDPQQADARLEELAPDVAVVDIRMPQMDGMELLSRIKARQREVEVVMMTGYGGVQEAVEAVKRGAFDFLAKPFESMEAAEIAVARAAEKRRLARRVQQLERQGLEGEGATIIGQSAPIRRVLELVRNVAASPASVLIIGESGTGKELVARAIHRRSPRNRKELVALNCSALPEALLESELFGHVKGAFTGATTQHRGLFQIADGGTVFLDEIGDMALSTQAKLLRTLQEGEVRPVGAARATTVDVRVISATNRDLEQRCAQGSFRRDLYYRLNVIRIDLPPLRERGDDIALLARHFLHKHERRQEKSFDGIEHDALQQLLGYSWPGNVRELENAIARAVAVAPGKLITTADLPPPLSDAKAVAAGDDLNTLPFAEAKTKMIERFERGYLEQQLRRHPSVSAAARAAGLDRSNFRRLLRRHGLTTR